ncbi:MAG: hypothetical protein AAFN07_15390 [Pseudomonadota bacterium]
MSRIKPSVGHTYGCWPKLTEDRAISDPEKENRNVTPLELIQAAIVVVTLLVLAWFKESGNQAASIIWIVLVFAVGVCFYFIRKTLNQDKDE